MNDGSFLRLNDGETNKDHRKVSARNVKLPELPDPH